MTVKEQVAEINEFFSKNRERCLSVDSAITASKSSCAAKAEQLRRKFRCDRDNINSKREDVLKFYRIAKDNTRAELMTDRQPKEPNIKLLSDMLDRINVQNYNDPTAAKMVEIISGYIAYFDKQIADINNLEKIELNKLESECARKQKELESRKQSFLKICSDFVSGPEVGGLRKILDGFDKNYGFTVEQLDKKVNGLNSMVLYGYQQLPLLAPSNIQNRLKAALGSHYANNYVDCPCGLNFSKHAHINAEYVPSAMPEVRNGIRALVVNVLKSIPTKYIRISIFDSINYSASLLGDMSPLAGLPGGAIDPIARNDTELKQSIKQLTEYYQKAERKIGSRSVFNYNGKVSPAERIPLRLMIVNKETNSKSGISSEMSYLYSNAEKLGIAVVELCCNREGGSKGTDAEKRISINSAGEARIISDKNGRFYKLQGNEFCPFRWHQAPEHLPGGYVASLEQKLQRKKKGPDYYSYFSLKLPEKSIGKRKPIVVPFARDENDNVVSCTFENENFAAYMMGAARSGKSTLLHTIICSIITNYHPDEVELWLVDFKMTEFRRYGVSRPPHLKYLLLEDSGDLIFDLIDELTDELAERMKIFSNRGWSKLSDVPPDIYMPAIFLIIDEFAQVSQKLRDSRVKNSGGTDYVRALENLLAKGAAFGMKFIFASQSYTTGVEGLSETARKQIQTRFALKNTSSEVKDTLDLTSYQLTDRILQLISTIQVYETLFKRVDESTGVPVVNKYYNLKVEMKELESTIKFLNSKLHPTSSSSGDLSYIDKHPVLLLDDKPLTFKSMIPKYLAFEKTMQKNRNYRDVDPDDILIYLGVPCSFKQVKPIVLKRTASQNMLVVGGDRDLQSSLLMSVIYSWQRKDRKLNNFEIWAHEQYPAFKHYKKRWSHTKFTCDAGKIKTRTEELVKDISSGRREDRIVICMGLDLLLEDYEDFFDLKNTNVNVQSNSKPAADGAPQDLFALFSSPDVTEKMRDAYNNTCTPLNNQPSGDKNDFRKNIAFLLSKGSKRGLHFVFLFTNFRSYNASGIGNAECGHRVVFAMPNGESRNIAAVDAGEIGDGEFIYSDGYKSFSMRPHIYKGIPCNGWTIDNDKIVKI